jgi:hypothetical protein
MADIEGLPVHTWGRSLAKVKRYAIEALALHIDVPEAEVAGRLVFRRPQLPGHVLEALDQAETARADADGAAARAAEAKATAARAPVGDAHLPCGTRRRFLVSRTRESSSCLPADDEFGAFSRLRPVWS